MSNNIVNKLIYLNDTKQLIKQAIIDKGVDITPDTPFREYASKIGEISGGGELPDELLSVAAYLKSNNFGSPSKWTFYTQFKLTSGVDGSMFGITSDIDSPAPDNAIFFSSAWGGSRFRINRGGDGDGTDYYYDFVGQTLYLKVTYENERLYGGLGLDKNYSQVSIDISNVPSRSNLQFTATPIWGGAAPYVLINPAETYIINEDTGEKIPIRFY